MEQVNFDKTLEDFGTSSSYYINDIYRLIKETDILPPKTLTNSFKIYFYFFFSISASFIILLVNLFYREKVNLKKVVALARVPRTKYKIKRVYNNIQFVEDNVKYLDFSIYRIGTRLERIKFIGSQYFINCINDFKEITSILDNNNLAKYSSAVKLEFSKRIPHTVVYNFAINKILSNYEPQQIFTGQMHDRFALIESKAAHKYSKKLVCIPHGVESAMRMPMGHVGDIFYCTSKSMADKLNLLYNTKKYIFDEEILKKMYQASDSDQKVKDDSRKVVFFTQPNFNQEIKTMIISISEYLKGINKVLYVKVHPYEKITNYQFEGIEIIEDLEIALKNNLCISISSTILIEALYNDSTSISTIKLINKSTILPPHNEFLNDSRIIMPDNINSVYKEIDKYFKDL